MSGAGQLEADLTFRSKGATGSADGGGDSKSTAGSYAARSEALITTGDPSSWGFELEPQSQALRYELQFSHLPVWGVMSSRISASFSVKV